MATIFKRGKIYWINYKNHNGRKVQKSTKLGDEKAAKVLKKHYDALEKSYHLQGTPLQGSIRLSELQEQYQESRVNRVAVKTLKRDKEAVNSLKAVITDKYLDQICSNDIESWYTNTLNNRTTATANCLYRHIKALFSNAVNKNYIDASPCTVKPVKENQKLIKTLSREEVNKILEVLPSVWVDLVKVALYTGARAGELCRLKVSDIDIQNLVVEIRSTNENPTKTKKSRVLPIPKKSINCFKALLDKSKDGYLLHNESGNLFTVYWIAHGFVKYAKKAGVECTFHDLRRTYGAWLVEKGSDLVTVKENLGHSNISTTVKHYSHVQMKHRHAQVDKLPEL